MSRALDLLLALVLGPLVGGVGLLVALAILLTDGLPVFFVQERVGRERRPFRLLKFRTMQDDQVTWIGRVLRRTGLDELPQLINVMRGDMSLVGPRPLTQADVVRLGWDGVEYNPRWSVRPGIVGPAQFQAALRCDPRLSWAHDHAYVRQHGLRMDVGILAAALLSVVAGRSAAARLLRLNRGSRR